MEPTEMSPLDRSRAVKEDLWTLQDVLEDANTWVGGILDPGAHRGALTRLEAICAVLTETSQMSGAKSSKRVLDSLVIALRQMQTAASIGLVGMNIPLAQGELVWLPHSEMKGSIGCSPGTQWIGSVEGWIQLAAYIRARRKGLLQDAKMATLFSWTTAYKSDALEDASLKPISPELIDDPYVLAADGEGPTVAANLQSFGRLLRGLDTAVQTRPGVDFEGWADEVRNGAELVEWIRAHAFPGIATAETVMEAARLALDVLTIRFEKGARWMVLQREKGHVRFTTAAVGIDSAPGAVRIDHFDAWYLLSDFVRLQFRLGNTDRKVREALLWDDGQGPLKKLTLRRLLGGGPGMRSKRNPPRQHDTRRPQRTSTPRKPGAAKSR